MESSFNIGKAAKVGGNRARSFLNTEGGSKYRANFARAIFLSLFFGAYTTGFAQTVETWDGGGGVDNWGWWNNWVVEDGLANNAEIHFGTAGNGQLNSGNDYGDWGIGVNQFVFDSGAGAYNISGDNINMNANGQDPAIINNSTSTINFNQVHLAWNNWGTFTADNGGQINMNFDSDDNMEGKGNRITVNTSNNSTVTWNSVDYASMLDGGGELHVTGDGTGTLNLNGKTTYTGDTYVEEGTIEMGTRGIIASDGEIYIGQGAAGNVGTVNLNAPSSQLGFADGSDIGTDYVVLGATTGATGVVNVNTGGTLSADANNGNVGVDGEGEISALVIGAIGTGTGNATEQQNGENMAGIFNQSSGITQVDHISIGGYGGSHEEQHTSSGRFIDGNVINGVGTDTVGSGVLNLTGGPTPNVNDASTYNGINVDLSIHVGATDGSSGTLNVSNTGGWSFGNGQNYIGVGAGDIIVGDEGDGRVNTSGTGGVGSQTLILGYQDNGHGVVNIEDTSKMQADDIIIGRDSSQDNRLIVNGGTLQTNGGTIERDTSFSDAPTTPREDSWINIADAAGSKGTLEVHAGEVNPVSGGGGDIVVGDGGNGNYVQTGGTVRTIDTGDDDPVEGGDFVIASDAGSTGNVVITGGTLSVEQNLRVGQNKDGGGSDGGTGVMIVDHETGNDATTVTAGFVDVGSNDTSATDDSLWITSNIDGTANTFTATGGTFVKDSGRIEGDGTHTGNVTLESGAEIGPRLDPTSSIITNTAENDALTNNTSVNDPSIPGTILNTNDGATQAALTTHTQFDIDGGNLTHNSGATWLIDISDNSNDVIDIASAGGVGGQLNVGGSDGDDITFSNTGGLTLGNNSGTVNPYAFLIARYTDGSGTDGGGTDTFNETLYGNDPGDGTQLVSDNIPVYTGTAAYTHYELRTYWDSDGDGTADSVVLVLIPEVGSLLPLSALFMLSLTRRSRRKS